MFKLAMAASVAVLASTFPAFAQMHIEQDEHVFCLDVTLKLADKDVPDVYYFAIPEEGEAQSPLCTDTWIIGEVAFSE